MAKSLYKKGINPLVATVVLIALAVSVGAVVMSLGGVYFEKARVEKLSCSKALISAFELEADKCPNYERSIVNFYRADEDIKTPACYKGLLTGKGDICATSDILFNHTWTPAKNVVR